MQELACSRLETDLNIFSFVFPFIESVIDIKGAEMKMQVVLGLFEKEILKKVGMYLGCETGLYV